MCGLAGLWRDPFVANDLDLQHSAAAMAAALDHRGPDDAGVWHESASGLALAHQRLAILDLSSRPSADAQCQRSLRDRF